MSDRILLIESDATVARVIRDALTQSSDEFFEVDWVRRCSEGLARLDGIVAILVDLTLPDIRGLEAFERLYRAAPRTPILVLIDPHDEETGKLAVQRGAQDYVFKSDLDNRLLFKATRSMIGRAACTEALFEEKERACVTLNSIGDAVVSTDVSCQITYLNTTAANLTGWTQEEAVGHPLEDVFKFVDAETRVAAPNPMALSIREDKAVTLIPNCVLVPSMCRPIPLILIRKP